MLNVAKLKVFPMLLLASLASVGCGDSVDELIDDLFTDKSYADDINFPAKVNSQCPAWARRQTVVIDASMKLPENCVFEQVGIKLSGSDIEFDCNNAVFNGMTTDPVSGTLVSGNALSKTNGIRFRNGAD